MNLILIATTNPAKLTEYRLLLRPFKLELVSPADLGIRETPEETGATFAENAILKARFYVERTGLPTLADDGGLEVDALGGAPGVRSHRWLGDADADDRALAEAVIQRMRGIPTPKRTTRLRAAIAIADRCAGVTHERIAEAAIEGIIAERAWPHIRPGFPYRAVLFLPDRGCYLAELGDEEEARISQRRIALEKLRDELELIAAGHASGTNRRS